MQLNPGSSSRRTAKSGLVARFVDADRRIALRLSLRGFTVRFMIGLKQVFIYDDICIDDILCLQDMIYTCVYIICNMVCIHIYIYIYTYSISYVIWYIFIYTHTSMI